MLALVFFFPQFIIIKFNVRVEMAADMIILHMILLPELIDLINYSCHFPWVRIHFSLLSNVLGFKLSTAVQGNASCPKSPAIIILIFLRSFINVLIESEKNNVLMKPTQIFQSCMLYFDLFL